MFNQRDRFDVDEYRKMRALERLPKIVNEYEDESQLEKHNFIRRPEQPIRAYDDPKHQTAILENECVREKVRNKKKEETDNYD
jgi:hypothetical protein